MNNRKTHEGQKTASIFEELKKLNPIGLLREAENNATPEEKQKLTEIKQKIFVLCKQKKFDEAKKFLTHLSKNEHN